MIIQDRLCRLGIMVVFALGLSGCAETEFVSHYAKKLSWPGQEQSVGKYKVGNPYKVGSVWYYPQEDFHLVETGIASWYGPDFHGKKTANGEVYDQNEMTAAHRTLQMPSFVRVTNLENGRSVVVRINDRGPYLHGRVIDMSKKAASLLGFINKGTARVRVEVLPNESRQVADAAKKGINTSRLTLADLDKMKTDVEKQPAAEKTLAAAQPIVRGPSVASLANDAEMLPESLIAPSITVEELSQTDQPVAPAPVEEPVKLAAPAAAVAVDKPMKSHLQEGRLLPDPVVAQMPVTPTGIFVQAGSFAVKDNATRLSQKLGAIAPVRIEPVVVNGKQLYRVRLGPLADVAAADSVLERVIDAGSGAAKVVRSQ